MKKFKYFEYPRAGHLVVHPRLRNVTGKLWVTRLALAKLLSTILLMARCIKFFFFFYWQGK